MGKKSIETVTEKMIKKLKSPKLEQVALVGSCVYGNPNEHNDHIITKDNYISKNRKKTNKLYLQYSKALIDPQKKIRTDIIVQTRKMHGKFLKLDNMFSRKITREGKAINEKRDNKEATKDSL